MARLKKISEIAKNLKINPDYLEPYGHYKAKIPLDLKGKKKNSNLVLVTSMSPTPQGIGKTTLSIGLSDALCSIGENSIAALREPSLGPIFGKKGGATGGGLSNVEPAEDINLHFNGDFAAIEKANNLLSALIDNYIRFQGQKYQIDPRTIVWKRVMDMNDRSLREIITGLGGSKGGVPRESGFDITAASEIMAILCLSNSLKDLKERIGRIYVGRTYDNTPVTIKDLGFEEPATLLLKEAIKPNLVQTSNGNPAIIHGGPFANIATGTNSLLATKTALGLADYVVTEAGFGAELGAEKFFNIICREGELKPSVAVILFSTKSLEFHGDGDLEKGFENLKRHYHNCKKFGIPVITAQNLWKEEDPKNLKKIASLCEKECIPYVTCAPYTEGVKGVEGLAKMVVESCKKDCEFHPTYDLDLPLVDKIKHLARDFYGAGQVKFTTKAKKAMDELEKLGFDKFPICMAKTPLSFSDDPSLRGAPQDFDFLIRDFEFSAGAGFIIPLAGDILRMPAFAKEPSALHMKIDDQGKITGLT
jgi:formate--tetrahydrofolate ligase